MKTIKQAKILYIAASVLFCLIGLAMILYPGISARIFCIAIGAILVFYGLSKILGYFSIDMYHLAFQFDLALGIFVSVLGTILLFHPQQVVAILPMLIGIDVVIDGVFKLQTSIDARRFGLRKWWLILLGSVFCVGIGIFLFFNPYESANLIASLTGIALLADGIQNLFNAFYTVKIVKRLREDRPKPIDAEWS